MTSAEKDISLFDAPDLAALQRNWPRIALRAGVLVLVPLCVTMLARSLDLYPTIRRLPLPLDFLDVGPFAYEAKVVFAIVATLLALAFLMTKRTAALVMAVCVGGILWTGHVYITLQWARLFATRFTFRADATPEPAAWFFAALLMAVGVVFLLLENLLDTRAQQEERGLPRDQTRALFDVGWRALALMVGLGAALSLGLVLAYVALRTALANTRLPFRLNPVFVLFGMGVALAVLVALASRKRTPVAEAAWMKAKPVVATAVPAPAPARAVAAPIDPFAVPAEKKGAWRRMRRAERAAFVLAILTLPALILPFTSQTVVFGGRSEQPALASPIGLVLLVAAVTTLVTYARRAEGRWRRGAPPTVWALGFASYALLVMRIQGPVDPQIGAFLTFLFTIGALSASLLAARRP